VAISFGIFKIWFFDGKFQKLSKMEKKIMWFLFFGKKIMWFLFFGKKIMWFLFFGKKIMWFFHLESY
jgi:hypothetical protein